MCAKKDGDVFHQLRDYVCVDTNHYKDPLALAEKELKTDCYVRQYLE